MSNILVYAPEEAEEERQLNKTRRQILYEKWAQSAPLDSYHFEVFYANEVKRNETKVPETTIPTILLKYILRYFAPIIRKPVHKPKISSVNPFKKKKQYFKMFKSSKYLKNTVRPRKTVLTFLTNSLFSSPASSSLS